MATFTQALKFENGSTGTLSIVEKPDHSFDVSVGNGPVANAKAKRSTPVNLGDQGEGSIAVQKHGDRIHYQFGACAIQIESRKGFLSAEAEAA